MWDRKINPKDIWFSSSKPFPSLNNLFFCAKSFAPPPSIRSSPGVVFLECFFCLFLTDHVLFCLFWNLFGIFLAYIESKIMMGNNNFYWFYSCKLSYWGHLKQAVERVRKGGRKHICMQHMKVQVWNHLGFLLEWRFLCVGVLALQEEIGLSHSSLIIKKLSTIDILQLMPIKSPVPHGLKVDPGISQLWTSQASCPIL